MWTLPSPATARWYRWWRCSERQRAESGRGLPFLASEPCWEPAATHSFHEAVAAPTERLEDVDAMVRFYVTVHLAEEGQRTMSGESRDPVRPC